MLGQLELKGSFPSGSLTHMSFVSPGTPLLAWVSSVTVRDSKSKCSGVAGGSCEASSDLSSKSQAPLALCSVGQRVRKGSPVSREGELHYT